MRFDLNLSFIQRSRELLSISSFQNFLAQSHSRDVLRYLRTPKDDWPEYTGTLDEDLVYTAQYVLYLGLRLKDAPDTTILAAENLTLGAEILEHVYGRSDDEDPERVTQLFTAALAYYMAGHFARAFVLVRDLESQQTLPRFLRPLRHLILKDFGQLRSYVISQLIKAEYSDDAIAAQLERAQIGEDQAYCRVFEATLFRTLSYFLEHLKTGAEPLLAMAEAMLDSGIELSVDLRFADWWWYLSCVRSMLATYRHHSLWVNLQPLLGQLTTEPITELYIRSNLRLPTPVVELWPSQVTAIPHLFSSADRKNLCLRMPTSAGKTKIAEIAILKFLSDYFDDPEAKCVFVAPYRSLAVEVEQTLKRVFLPLGIRVSELYGGFELTLADRVLIERTHILVATPEKLDALFRFSPDLVPSIKLIILDEGHIIAPPNFRSIRQSRGLKYEVFLLRLVRRFESTATRIVFLSAVMPNAEQFAEWITGDPSGLVTSAWRPSRLMLGEAVWDGTTVSIEYTHANHRPLEHRCFVRKFVTQIPAASLPDRRRRKPFPKDDAEALALTAIEFATRGLTMIFVARKTSAEPLGRTICSCLEIRSRLAASAAGSFSLPVDDKHRDDLRRCIQLIREQMGEDSEIAKFVEAGFVVHHGSLPQAVRLGLERLVRAGAVRLVVATSTLAQGVNFPIHTVLVHSLDHGHNDPVSPMDFWNISGRAGRGMKENEGQVLFFVCQCFEEWKASRGAQDWLSRLPEPRQRQKWREWCGRAKATRHEYIRAYGNYRVNSALLEMVVRVADLWKHKHSSVNMGDLCEALANHRLDLFAPSEETDLDGLLSCLDGLLISLTEECEGDPVAPELFDKLLHRSLLFLQLQSDGQRQDVSRFFAARMQYVHKRHPDPLKRRQFYRLGLPLRDCEKVDAWRQELLGIYMLASDYGVWNVEQRSIFLATVAEYLFQLNEIIPSSPLPSCWRRILHLWLTGLAPAAIASDSEAAQHKLTALVVSRFIDDVCGYRLPWGYNMLSIYFKQEAQDAGLELPSICDYFSAFIKYGVHEPAACWLLTLGVPSRAVAMRGATYVGSEITDPRALLQWLREGGVEEMRGAGMDAVGLGMIKEVLSDLETADRRRSRPSRTFRIPLPSSGCTLEVGDRILMQRISDDRDDGFSIYNVRGDLIGAYTLEPSDESFWSLLDAPELVDAQISSMEETPDGFIASIVAQSV
jgi:superfamily II DNA/RNA helicase